MENHSEKETSTNIYKRLSGRSNAAEDGAASTEYEMIVVEESGKEADRFLSKDVLPAARKEVTSQTEAEQESSGREEEASRVAENDDAEDRKASFTPDHEVLTRDGWKRVGKLTTSDEVATLRPGTDEIQYQAPTGTQQSRRESKMYRVESQQIDLKVTPDHKMYVNPRNPKINGKEYAGHRLMRADSIAGKRVRYKTSGDWTGTSSSTVQLDALDVGTGKGSNNQVLSDYATKTKVPTDALFELTGLFLAEGFTHGDDSGNYRIQISQCPEVHPDIYDRIAELFRKCGASAHECLDRVIGINKQLYNLMDKIPSGAANKRVPPWMLHYDTPHLKALLKGLMAGDGHETATGYHAYTSTSKGLCDDVHEIAIKTGKAARVFQVREARTSTLNGRKINEQACFRTHVRTKRLTPTINHSHVDEQDAQTEEFVKYSGTVHGCTVPNGVVYVRRNGKACWCGSSSGAV